MQTVQQLVRDILNQRGREAEKGRGILSCCCCSFPFLLPLPLSLSVLLTLCAKLSNVSECFEHFPQVSWAVLHAYDDGGVVGEVVIQQGTGPSRGAERQGGQQGEAVYLPHHALVHALFQAVAAHSLQRHSLPRAGVDGEKHLSECPLAEPKSQRVGREAGAVERHARRRGDRCD